LVACLPAFFCSEYSKTLNDARLKVLAARETAIQSVVKEARARVRDVARNPGSYKKLLQDLLVQVGLDQTTVIELQLATEHPTFFTTQLSQQGRAVATSQCSRPHGTHPDVFCSTPHCAAVLLSAPCCAVMSVSFSLWCVDRELLILCGNVQAMHKLGEPTALVKVRQADTMLVKEVMEAARKQYAGEQQTHMPNYTSPLVA
jgi:hypothetical protein